MTGRELPNRRDSRTMKIEYAELDGTTLKAHVTYSKVDSLITEVFITAGKPGSQGEAALRDAGLLLSLCLQEGIPLEKLAGAVTRNQAGKPAGPLGIVLDALLVEEGRTDG